jgi:hypothetical protein
VLTVTQMLRKHGVVGKFVEFFGDGLQHLPLADRATIANMAPEYGATCGIFPIDAESLTYLRLSGRSEAQIALVEAYAKAQGLWHDAVAARELLRRAATRHGLGEALAGRPEAPAGSRAAGRTCRPISTTIWPADREPQGAQPGRANFGRRRRSTASRAPRSGRDRRSASATSDANSPTAPW